jgi:hypothetical protein
LIPKRRRRKQKLWVKDDDDDRFLEIRGSKNFYQTLVRESEEKNEEFWT